MESLQGSSKLVDFGALRPDDSIALFSGLVHQACIHPACMARSAKHAHTHSYLPARIWEPCELVRSSCPSPPTHAPIVSPTGASSLPARQVSRSTSSLCAEGRRWCAAFVCFVRILSGSRAHADMHDDHLHAPHPPPRCALRSLHEASLTNVTCGDVRLRRRLSRGLRSSHGVRQRTFKRNDVNPSKYARERGSNARPLSHALSGTRSQRPRTRIARAALHAIGERPRLEGV